MEVPVSEPFDFETLIDANEVARLFKFTPQHIRRLAERKIIPAARYGREWRFRRSDLNRAFQEACTGTKNVDMFSVPISPAPSASRRPRGRPRNNP
jgi:excisionase family DNA binding protein